jgi:hypothetical protein
MLTALVVSLLGIFLFYTFLSRPPKLTWTYNKSTKTYTCDQFPNYTIKQEVPYHYSLFISDEFYNYVHYDKNFKIITFIVQQHLKNTYKKSNTAMRKIIQFVALVLFFILVLLFSVKKNETQSPDPSPAHYADTTDIQKPE